MQFLVDENVPVQLIDWLQKNGHDAKRVPSGIKNGQVLALANSDFRILITQDKDFANRLQYPPAKFHGLIVLRIHPPVIEQLLAGLKKLLTEGPSDYSKKLVILESTGFHLLDS